MQKREAHTQLTMKPWEEYTAEDDERLYTEDFDLEAILNAALAERNAALAESTQGPPREEPQLVGTESTTTQAPSPAEESRLVQEVRQQLEEALAELQEQKNINQSLKKKAKMEETLAQQRAIKLKDANMVLQKTKAKLNQQVLANKELQAHVNKERLEKENIRAQAEQQLADANKTIAELKKTIQDLDENTAKLQKEEERQVLQTTRVKGLEEKEGTVTALSSHFSTGRATSKTVQDAAIRENNLIKMVEDQKTEVQRQKQKVEELKSALIMAEDEAFRLKMEKADLENALKKSKERRMPAGKRPKRQQDLEEQMKQPRRR